MFCFSTTFVEGISEFGYDIFINYILPTFASLNLEVKWKEFIHLQKSKAYFAHTTLCHTGIL